MSRVLLLIAAMAAAFAQSNGDSEGPQRLVRLTVVATSSKGDSVTDLRASDIRIREDGKVRPAVFFRFDGSRRAVALAGQGEAVHGAALTPTVLLFDRWNERLITAADAWNDVSTTLRRMESVDRIFIYFLTNKGALYPVHPLPATDADLRNMDQPTPAQLSAKLDEAMRKLQGFRSADVLDPVYEANTTLQALSAVGTQMASIAGRKNLIWVTHGIPLTLMLPGLEPIDFTPQVRQLSVAAAESQIAIYTVDESAQGAGADPTRLSAQTLQMMSSLTGGRWYPSDDAEPALNGALADGRAAYRIAYYSPIRAKDRKEHKIRAESSQKGVRLLTREGYFGDAGDPDVLAVEQATFAAERRSPFDATDIGLRVALSPVPSGKATHFAIHIDPADVLLEQRDGNYQGELSLMFAGYSQGFLKQATAPIPINVDLKPEQYAKAQKDGLDLSQDLAMKPDIDKVRVMVFDRRLFGLGSVTVAALK